MLTEPATAAPGTSRPGRPSVKSLVFGPFTVVWCVLIAATLLTWYVGEDGIRDHHVASVVILLVAFVKVRFVGLYFMELRDAPALLRTIFELHCVVVCSVMMIVYLVEPLAPR